MAAKITTEPTRSGDGLVVKADGLSVAWATAKGGTLGTRYRKELNGAKPDPQIVAALERAVNKLRKAAK